MGLGTPLSLASALWPVVELCNSLFLLEKETSLMSSESYSYDSRPARRMFCLCWAYRQFYLFLFLSFSLLGGGVQIGSLSIVLYRLKFET